MAQTRRCWLLMQVAAVCYPSGAPWLLRWRGTARQRPASLRGAERNKALGLWGAIGASGATSGLITGGLLTRYVGWEYIFFLNVPVGAVALMLIPRIVPEAG